MLNLPDHWQEVYEERAAIMEHDGKMAKELAEEAAMVETLQKIKQCDYRLWERLTKCLRR